MRDASFGFLVLASISHGTFTAAGQNSAAVPIPQQPSQEL